MTRAHARNLSPEADGPRPAAWEWVAAALVIIMMTGALIGPLFAPDQGETPVLRLVWLPAYAVIFMLAIRRAREILVVWPGAVIAAGLVGLAWLSHLWSLEPDVTVRRSIALAITMLFALYLAGTFRGANLLRLLCWAFIAMQLMSLVAVFANPVMGIHQDVNAGMWRGVWYEKNQLGMMMFTAALSGLALIVSGERGRPLALVTIGLALVLLLGSQSKTSLLCLIAGSGVIIGLYLLRRTGPAAAVALVWLGVVVGSAALAFIAISPETFFTLLGKDPSLTGRTDIWDALMRRAAERPVTGYGYAAFWGKESMPANWVRLETDWDVPSAHQGWLEVLVQLGWAGAVAVAATAALALFMTLARLPRLGAQEGYFGAGYLVAVGVLTLSESVLMLHHNLTWSLCIVVLASRFLPAPEPRTAASPAARRGSLSRHRRMGPAVAGG